ncbi:MAG: hypothetical protein AB1650_01400 [Candidatus Omnitrophota bacterium]
MYQAITKNRFSTAVRFISVFLLTTFVSTTILPPGYSQSIGLSLPTPGTMVSQSPAFVPVLLKGMTVHPENPFEFDFIIDSGHEKFKQEDLKKESERLVKYFLASMTVPQNDLWVNLSPYEKDRIIPEELGKTELGRDLLEQDYILKQLTATMMYPEEELGKKFWERVRKLAKDKYGITEIPTDTFNKVWILPETATVFEYENTVYITDAHLKIMLDTDYFAMTKTEDQRPQTEVRELSESVIREIILPEIEKEINTGKNFATLRQIYHSLILAKWYKQTVKNSIMSQVYIDKNKIAGIDINDPQMKEKIYDRYMQAYKKGVFNYIKEDYDELSHTVTLHEYFSGGFNDQAILVENSDDAIQAANTKVGDQHLIKTTFLPENSTAKQALSSDDDKAEEIDLNKSERNEEDEEDEENQKITESEIISYISKSSFLLGLFWAMHTQSWFRGILVSVSILLISFSLGLVIKSIHDFSMSNDPLKLSEKEKANAAESDKNINKDTDQSQTGGIDMNTISINRQGKSANRIQLEMNDMEPLLNMDIQGFSPVIIDMIPINSVLPLLGLMPTEKGIKYGQEEAEETLQLSSI